MINDAAQRQKTITSFSIGDGVVCNNLLLVIDLQKKWGTKHNLLML